MKQQIINQWLKMGFSYSALKLQRLLKIEGNTAVLLNKKHGLLTYVQLG